MTDPAGVVASRVGSPMELHERLTGAQPQSGDDERWTASGAMALTGDDRPVWAPAGLVPFVLAVEHELAELSAELGNEVAVDALALLGERAAILGLTRRGQTSCGGSTRLLRARGDWLAVALPRADDLELLPAWLGITEPADMPDAIAHASANELVERGALLGLPLARLGEVRPYEPVAESRRFADGPPRTNVAGCVVVDLSALWAGPLCGHLLTLAGARVIKVESAQRLDGARRSPPEFFDLLHAGQESVLLDLPSERLQLRRLLEAADVVIEASRPRAMEQLGIDAAEVAAAGTVWVSITGHGRSPERRHRIAFGDDAAVAGGLVAGSSDRPMFCADAVADPLAGLTAAVAVLDRLRVGGRWMLDIAMAKVAAWCARWPSNDRPPPARVAEPRARRPCGRAAPAGSDSDRVRREFAL